MSSTSTLIHPTTSTTAPYTTFSPGSSSAGPASATEPCPHCGAPANLLPSASDDAQRRISELEQQVRLLSDKATAAGKPSPSPHISSKTLYKKTNFPTSR